MSISAIVEALGAAAAAAMLLAVAGPASAAMSDQEVDRFTVIAGGWQLERHCNHLDRQSHDELAGVAAHAELQVAEEIGSDRVRDIMAAARAFGDERGASCGTRTREEVELSLALAQDYASERSGVAEVVPLHEEEPAQVEAAPTEQASVQPTQPVTSQDLTRFGEQTRAYYLQRRCGHLAYRQDYHFWELIAHQHAVMVRRFGAGAIRRMQREAETSANSASFVCGGRTRAMVNAGYAAIRADTARN